MTDMMHTEIAGRFMPHGYCLLWRPELVWMHALADLVIAISFISIPLIIFFILHKRKKMIPFSWIIFMFASFIFLCGLTHLLGMVGIWHSFYYLEGIIKILTAAISIATVILLFPLVPVLLKRLETRDAKNNLNHHKDDVI